MSHMARRKALVSLGAMFVSAVLAPCKLVAGDISNSGHSRLLNILGPDLAAARRLGQAYLASHPNEFDPRLLIDGVLDALRISGRAGAIDSIQECVLVARARRAVTDEYVSGRVVDVDGWVLSLTEARLYALTVFDNVNVR
jgi:hypothetical protein